MNRDIAVFLLPDHFNLKRYSSKSEKTKRAKKKGAGHPRTDAAIPHRDGCVGARVTGPRTLLLIIVNLKYLKRYSKNAFMPCTRNKNRGCINTTGSGRHTCGTGHTPREKAAAKACALHRAYHALKGQSLHEPVVFIIENTC